MKNHSHPSRTHDLRRHHPDGILESVAKGGRITLPTLTTLLALLAEKTDHRVHIAVEVCTGMMLKTIDNEADALETIERLRAVPPRASRSTR